MDIVYCVQYLYSVPETCAGCEYGQPQAPSDHTWSVAQARGENPPAVIFRSRSVSPSSQPGTVQIIIAMSHFTCAKLNRMGRVDNIKAAFGEIVPLMLPQA